MWYSWDVWCCLLGAVFGFCYGLHRAKSKGSPMEKHLSFILIISSVALFISILVLKFIFWEHEKEYLGIYVFPLGAFGLSGSLLAVTDVLRSWEED